MVRVRDIKVKTNRMNTQPRLGLRPRFPYGKCLAIQPDYCILESEYIYNDLVDTVCLLRV